jgi:NADH-quinone oxidoreductase subunit L
MENLLFLIPLLPFAGFLANGLLGARLRPLAIASIGCAGPAAAFALALAASIEVGRAGSGAPALHQLLWTWIAAGEVDVSFGLTLDRLAAVMALVVTGVGALIHLYSVGYMRGDAGYARFFAYLNLFLAAMLVLVLADNILLLFLGWEGVGLCSYLLIGFWYRDLANCAAGIKAFVVNRVGDLGFLPGIFAILVTFGTFDLGDINSAAASAGGSAVFWIALLLFIGATGKSAQIPLHVWLPDAMAGPTPVSALIHAATMVTSGVYMVARLGPLYDAAPGIQAVVAAVGALTALLAAVIAFSQSDIKKVLAYSTISQLGYMFLAAGMGAYAVAIFHVVTHAFFKALLFLGAGAVIHSLHHEQDLRRMGGLAKPLPQTFALFLAGALALAGFPLTAGFFSKDEILHVTQAGVAGATEGRLILWSLGLLTAFLTALYTFRLVALVFLGERRDEARASGGKGAIHEAPLTMRAPLYVLAILSLAGGFLPVVGFVDPQLEVPEAGKLLGLAAGGVIAIAGIAAALFVFVRRPELVRRFCEENPAGRVVYRLSREKLYVDEFYERFVVRPVGFLAELSFYVIDRALIDFLLVHGSGHCVRGFGALFRRLQSGRVPTYAVWFLAGVVGVLAVTLWMAAL